MKRLIVFVPEGIYLNYFVFSFNDEAEPTPPGHGTIIWKGRIKFRGSWSSAADIGRLIARYSPEAVAVRILFGGNEFDHAQIYRGSVLHRLETLVPLSPLHLPFVIKLLEILGRIVPAPLIILFFETAYFTHLPDCDRTYAIDEGSGTTEILKRFGYNGLLHRSACRTATRMNGNYRRVLSICLEPVPEVAGIYDGRPVIVSSGSTPLEGLPGNTSSGEIDPGIVLLLEEKKRWGPEKINDVLTRQSGLSAVAGEPVTIEEVLAGVDLHHGTREFFEYRILLWSGSAAAAMNGIDAIVFSGRYSPGGLPDWLVSRLAASSTSGEKIPVYLMQDSVEKIIARDSFEILKKYHGEEIQAA